MREKCVGVIKASLKRISEAEGVFTTGVRGTERIFAWGAGEQGPGSQEHLGGFSSSPTRNKKKQYVSYSPK
jgi:hypothetical protein